MQRSRKLCQRGSKFDVFFFSCWGERGSKYLCKWAIIHPPAKCHLNGVCLVCRWCPNIECWLGSFVIFQGVRTSIAKKPYNFVIFQEEPRPSVPPLDRPMHMGWVPISHEVDYKNLSWMLGWERKIHPRITVWHHRAHSPMMINSDLEGCIIFYSILTQIIDSFSCWP